MSFEPGTRLDGLRSGAHVDLGILTTEAKNYTFNFKVSLQGMESLQITPLGKNASVKMRSDWSHPGFNGRFLPRTRSISNEGFEAEWGVSHFASNIAELATSCVVLNSCANFNMSSLGVTFVDPVNVYLKSERVMKYGILFIGLIFTAFFFYELLKKLQIHPIQYSFVGIGLLLFYLLLISLSEHIAFSAAYISASTSCVLLLGYYVSYVLRSFSGGVTFGVLLSAIYGSLYVLTSSEDYALLMGSLLLFVVLSVIIVITRRVDWYELMKVSKSPEIDELAAF